MTDQPVPSTTDGISTSSSVPLMPLAEREWLVTNGLGGYASGTVGGVMTRKYHGYLVAALPTPLGRVVMLQNLVPTVVLPDGEEVVLTHVEQQGERVAAPTSAPLAGFRLVLGQPVWEYHLGGLHFEQRVVMPHGQNTTYVMYRLLSAPPEGSHLRLRPFMHFRSYEEPVTTPQGVHRLVLEGPRIEVQTPGALPPLRMHLAGCEGAFTANELRVGDVFYRVEQERGYESVGESWSPGYYDVPLHDGATVALVASTESWDTMTAMAPLEACETDTDRRRRLLGIAGRATADPVVARLTIAADQFIITPEGRTQDAARAAAAGDEVRTVIAGYHWFTDWGRDTMISLEGLTLCTGRQREAGYILRTFAHYVRDGLIPNMFPDGANEGLYHTADATLWFFHALHRYVRNTGDEGTLRFALPRMLDIIEQHARGTRFGIGVDPTDGLLRQGAEGYQLTWMDAKVDGWVVTPRRGKAVEINALWYNALRLTEGWMRHVGDSARADRLAAMADRAYASFNARFWNPETDHLFDVVDAEHGGNDAACRPNQIFAISLDNPVLDPGRWAQVLEAVRARLLTPYGLRSLAPGSPDYKPRYFGDLRTRDAAYHQGTAWGWLIGPFVDAWLRVHPEDRAGARGFLTALVAHLDDFGLGSIAEIFDADPPFMPRGCIAQAWSVAELLRAWLRSAPAAAPPAASPR